MVPWYVAYLGTYNVLSTLFPYIHCFPPPPPGSMIPATYDVEVSGEGTCVDTIRLKLSHESYVGGDVNR